MDRVELAKVIIAVVTLERGAVAGGAPIFYARDRGEQERVARAIARITQGMVHDLENGSYIVVRH